MKRNPKVLEERIVKLEKVVDGQSSVEEAELRHLELNGMEPQWIRVVLAKEFGVQLTLEWDLTIKRFKTEIAGIVWYSDFDYKDYTERSFEEKSIARSPRRLRAPI